MRDVMLACFFSVLEIIEFEDRIETNSKSNILPNKAQVTLRECPLSSRNLVSRPIIIGFSNAFTRCFASLFYQLSNDSQ